MKHLDGILEMVDHELGSIEQNGQFRSKDEVHSVYELIDIAKDIFCIWKYEDEDEYSEAYPMPYRYGSYDDGASYARGRRNAKRDSMGRYSRDGYNMRGGNYRRDGYSRDDAKQEYIDNLREMINNAPDEQTRMSLQRMVENMER